MAILLAWSAMARACVGLLLLAACGRLGFDSRADARSSEGPAQDADGPAIPPGAKLWLQMGTDPTTGIVDSAGGHTVVCTASSCPAPTAGKHGAGYRFTGQEVEVMSTPDLDPSAGFTAAAWVNVASDPASDLAAIFAKPVDAVRDTFVLAVGTDGTATFDSEDGSGATDAFSGMVLPTGEWHHVAFVWDGTNKVGYVDGRFVASHQVGIGANAMPLFVGADDTPAGYFLDGVLDDVIYYTRALTALEIAQLATP